MSFIYTMTKFHNGFAKFVMYMNMPRFTSGVKPADLLVAGIVVNHINRKYSNMSIKYIFGCITDPNVYNGKPFHMTGALLSNPNVFCSGPIAKKPANLMSNYPQALLLLPSFMAGNLGVSTPPCESQRYVGQD